MKAEQWARITIVFRAALEKPESERRAFLDSACASDDALRRKVERLLAAEADPTVESPPPEFLESAALEFSPGETLAQYRIEAKIGQGGMGAVYRAYDTRLRRAVALKVLPPEHFADLDGQRRLLREARAASSLNHPNIVTIYEIGSAAEVVFIAMECVEGKTLDHLIPPRGLPTAEFLCYAVQIAAALTEAHRAGVLHRDLKPSNIMVTGGRLVKLLDFGLAKTSGQAPAPDDSALRLSLTEEGTVAGTAAYMSPEQAEGRKLDARSDIFSFGSVLYEMATGKRAFTGDSRLALLTSVVRDDPAPPGQFAPVPPAIERLILRCLRKDPSRRYQSMADLKIALEDLDAEGAGAKWGPRVLWAGYVSQPARARRAALFAGIAAAMLAGVGAVAMLARRSPEVRPERTVKFTITPASLVRSNSENEIDAEVSISRDGKHIAYVESPGGQLWIRDIDQEQPRPVPGATGVYQVFWSPDNQSLGYASGRTCGIRRGCDLVRIPVQGGEPVPIVALHGPFRRASWSSDGETILFCDTTGMYTVPAKGGPVTRIVEHPHIEHPSFLDLPGGRHAYLYQAADREHPGHAIYVQVAGENQRRLIATSSSVNPYPAYSPTGHIVYVDGQRDETTIWAVPFSLETLQTTGRPFPIAPHGASPAVALSGTLVYSDVPTGRLQLMSLDRRGETIGLIGGPQRQNGPRLSPDGRLLEIAVSEGDPDLWIYDLERGVRTRLTSDAAVERTGPWTPAGDQIAYASNRNGSFQMFAKAPGGSSEEKLLSGAPGPEFPLDWSADGKFLIYAAISGETRSDLLYRERRSDGSLGEPVVFLRTRFDETSAQFSPDGRFVVYVSDESGAREVYVRDFPKGARKWQISASGGVAPRWRRDGKEILYVEESKLMAVSVAERPAFSPGTPIRLFEKGRLRAVSAAGFDPNPQYDVSADGKRFVILDKPAGEPPLSIHVVHNWFEEFRGREQAR